MPGASSIDGYRDGLAPIQRETVDRLRTLAASSAPGLDERIKWNAPSFARDDIDRITLGIERNGDIRVVLHRGAKARTPEGFSFDAPADLVTWAAPDRGIMRFSSHREVEGHEHEIADVFRRWMEID
jgi:hypothetical protein